MNSMKVKDLREIANLTDLGVTADLESPNL